MYGRVWCSLDWIYKLMIVGVVLLAYVLYLTYVKLRKEVRGLLAHVQYPGVPKATGAARHRRRS